MLLKGARAVQEVDPEAAVKMLMEALELYEVDSKEAMGMDAYRETVSALIKCESKGCAQGTQEVSGACVEDGQSAGVVAVTKGMHAYREIVSARIKCDWKGCAQGTQEVPGAGVEGGQSCCGGGCGDGHGCVPQDSVSAYQVQVRGRQRSPSSACPAHCFMMPISLGIAVQSQLSSGK